MCRFVHLFVFDLLLFCFHICGVFNIFFLLHTHRSSEVEHVLWLFHLCVARAQTSTAFPLDGQVCLFSIFFLSALSTMHCERVVVYLENVCRRQTQHFLARFSRILFALHIRKKRLQRRCILFMAHRARKECWGVPLTYTHTHNPLHSLPLRHYHFSPPFWRPTLNALPEKIIIEEESRLSWKLG